MGENLMLNLKTIRYMGIKTKLLEPILEAIKSVTPADGIVCDLMAGSNAVSYALKEFYTVYTNDVQYYSYIISKAVIENQSATISKMSASLDLEDNIIFNKKNKVYDFFEKTYSNTYFSKEQCVDIDSILYAIEKINDSQKKSLYLFALMTAMCKVQSTPGHFAQYMPSTHKRIIPLQQMNLLQEFKDKCNQYSDIFFSNKTNKAFCKDYKELFSKHCIDNVDTIYLDSPYSQEQYSRFYHILETVVKYDNPEVHYKAKYRNDRFMSDFCYKKKVGHEFETIIKYAALNKINLVISYSNKGVISIEKLLDICNIYFQNVSIKYIEYKHSTQGKGNTSLSEVIITCQ